MNKLFQGKIVPADQLSRTKIDQKVDPLVKKEFMMEIIGRKTEQKVLASKFATSASELIVY